ncbi:OpgC family protein [Methylocystis sp. Sn-Cys]|uniref:OpgC family protein n=1 Tax=Methylocystis sp. Sn-Cys TaxID=1701263 RepID=UPI001920AE2E|nr:OpgC domain-containing protein [Methylocystis sp. Sn-Cys]MBL1256310.1 OpgC domain-containing protein [Methylocystis sp. Sn-Cys]
MRERIDEIDFWRGIALVTIFINHIPGNILGNITPRNFGFSDSAEAFVFLSGVSVSLAYGNRFQSAALFGAASLVKRALRLYGVHLVLTIAALALFGLASAITGQDSLLAEHGRGTPFADPLRGVLGILTLTHQIGYFNILPLYVVLLFAAPALFVLGLQNRWKMLAVSAASYAFARWSGINAPSWPDEGFWYFNPFAWQLMFALGMFCGFGGIRRRFTAEPVTYRLAHSFTLGAALIVSNCFGFVPGLVDAAGEYLDWDKTQLGTVRILDFMALAYVIYCSGFTQRLRSVSLYPATSLMGRHALPVYCLGSVLSAVGQIIRETYTASPLFDVVFVAVSLKGLHAVAALIDRRKAAQFAVA